MKLIYLMVLLTSTIALAQRPAWINNPGEGCTPLELCGVGEGSGLMSAEAAARRALALIFKAQIKSESTSTKSVSQTGGDELLSSDITEETQFFVTEITDKVIEGSVVKKRFEKEGRVFVLVALKKRKAAARLKSEMDLMDQKMKSLLKEGKRSSLHRILKMYDIRETLNRDYEFLTNFKNPAVISLAEVQRKRLKYVDRKTTLKVQIFGDDTLKSVESTLVQALLDSGFRIVPEANSSSFAIKGEFKSDRLFLNLKGFEKHQFHLTLYTQNKLGSKIGALNYSTVKLARSGKQAMEKAMLEMKSFIKENLDELNID